MLVLPNMTIEPSNVRKKNKGTIECDKSTVICDISTTQCDDGTIKCDILVTWYSRLLSSGYHTPQKKGGYARITHILVIGNIINKYLFMQVEIAKKSLLFGEITTILFI